MDILSLNKKMVCPKSDIKLVGHVIDTGVNPVGILAGRVETVRYADVAGDTSRTLGGGKIYDYSDRYGTTGHGTGVAYLMCHDVPNMRIRSYNNQVGDTLKALAAVVEYVKAHPEERHIVNMSFKSGGSDGLHNYIKELVALNVAVVVSAGNDGREAMDIYPSCYEEPMTVAAVHSDGTKANFSVWHNEVDFTEAGVSIPTLTKDGDMVKMSGTSFSSPIVCNKLAKIWCANPALTEAQLYEQAKANCMDLGAGGRDPYFGWGWIASVKAAEPIEPPKPISGKLTAAKLVDYFRKAVNEKWGYVWSLNGELYTQKMAQKFHADKRSTSVNRDPATYWLQDCARWIGGMAADCSGGIIGAIRTVHSYIDKSANTFFKECTEWGAVDTIPETAGLCVWRDGHIGIYEGGGNVLEFRGTEYGAVRTRLAERTFTHWGRLRDIDYGEGGEEVKVITKNLSFDRDVQALQSALNALGYDCGTADGKAGDKTLAGIKAFVDAHGAALPDTLTLEISGNRIIYERMN